MKMSRRIINQNKNENAAAERTRVVCYGHKEAYKNVNYGSCITLAHGPDFGNDHNVIDVFADGTMIGHVIHAKHPGDHVCNIKNNDEVIDLIHDGMIVNLVLKRANQLLIDIPNHKYDGLL